MRNELILTVTEQKRADQMNAPPPQRVWPASRKFFTPQEVDVPLRAATNACEVYQTEPGGGSV